MRTFSIQTLGCKVNQYESEQIATLLRSRGLTQTDDRSAELRIVNTCSVTIQAASKSRQTARRLVRLPILQTSHGLDLQTDDRPNRPRLILTGCWATSDAAEARAIPGVDAVLGHHDDLASELDKLLLAWRGSDSLESLPPKSVEDDGWIYQDGTLANKFVPKSRPKSPEKVKRIRTGDRVGTTRLPLLGEHQTGRQRAFLKIQDGCDAHCTYCIIPQLRPTLWSKPVDDAVEEAKRLIDAGHVEIVLTGIFLGAYGHETALRRHQAEAGAKPVIDLVDSLCSRVAGLRRLRFSSLEPGDMTADLITAMRNHEQVVPHFHLPLQSGSDRILHRMNRQYTRDDFRRMIERVREGFDRPAITTDILAGFPGETSQDFGDTMEISRESGFIHIHAFSYSPRPRTAAARWTSDFVHGPVVNERIDALNDVAAQNSFTFRRQFEGEIVEVMIEQTEDPVIRHGRSERYFDVHLESSEVNTGDLVKVRVDRVSPHRTIGSLA